MPLSKYLLYCIEKDVDRLIEDLDKAFAKYRGAYHIGSKSNFWSQKEKGAEKKSQRTGDWTLQITDEKEPWEESLLNFVMSQIYMEFSKSIQSMKKHYFYSHQKPTKLVYEICLIPIVLWGKLETSSWFLLYIGSAQLIRTYVFFKIGFWWKNPLPSTLRCPRKLLYQYSRAIWSILEVLNAIF